MKIVDLQQGSPEWHAHRAKHFNASDAPAMMGASKYKTRTQLLQEYATGIRPEVDSATQYLFDKVMRQKRRRVRLPKALLAKTCTPSPAHRKFMDCLCLPALTAW